MSRPAPRWPWLLAIPAGFAAWAWLRLAKDDPAITAATAGRLR